MERGARRDGRLTTIELSGPPRIGSRMRLKPAFWYRATPTATRKPSQRARKIARRVKLKRPTIGSLKVNVYALLVGLSTSPT